MSDTWREIQALKSRQTSLKEKMQRRKKERDELLLSITGELVGTGSPRSNSPVPSLQPVVKDEPIAGIEVKADPQVEHKLLLVLCDAINLPTDSRSLTATVAKSLNQEVSHDVIENLLQKFATQELIAITENCTPEGKKCLLVSSAEHTKLQAVANDLCPQEKPLDQVSVSRKRKVEGASSNESWNKKCKRPEDIVQSEKSDEVIESLLSLESTKEKELKKVGEEILELLSKPTAKERSLVEQFRSQGGTQVQEFCPHGTKEECIKDLGMIQPCNKLHFRKIIQKHTDESLGDCSFLNTCFHMDTCKYVHYEVDYSSASHGSKPQNVEKNDAKMPADNSSTVTPFINPSTTMNYRTDGNQMVLFPPQWIQCDLRYFDMTVLGKFSVIMADPPWDIHMELPYGTMSDDEMRHLNVPSLQDDGLIFLWVTGRAMELGRECLQLWGYERCDEIIWVKTNQLQRIIRTGRTGHWLNHGKEHCLVGIKGNPKDINRGLDCDVIVAEVRATSHKPDEIYGIIERLSPGTRKIELFGRPHNVQPNWITLGNQVEGIHLSDPTLIDVFERLYPDGNCMKKPES